MKHTARLDNGRRSKRTRFTEDAGEFLSWWGKTLTSMLPSGLVNAYSTRRQSIYIWQTEDGFSAARPGKKELGDITQSTGLRRRVAASDPVLILDQSDVLVRQRRLPVASLNRLSHVMRLQVAAETPFNLDEIYSAVRTVGAPDSDGNILVEQAIVKCDVADNFVSQLSALEVDLAGADIVDTEGRPAGFNLLPEEKRARQGAFLPTVNRILTVAAVALAVALGGSWYVDLSRQAVAMERTAADTGKIAREVLGLQSRAQSDVDAIQQIDTAKANPGRFAAAFAAVTEALGNESWLEGFTYTGNSVLLAGLTQESEKLISELEASPIIESARFSSSVITDSRLEAERFRINVTFIDGDAGANMALVEDRG